MLLTLECENVTLVMTFVKDVHGGRHVDNATAFAESCAACVQTGNRSLLASLLGGRNVPLSKGVAASYIEGCSFEAH